MSDASTTTLRSIWARAAEAEIGIAIPTKELTKLKNELYEARAGFVEYTGFRIVLPAGGEELWIVRDTVDVLEGQG